MFGDSSSRRLRTTWLTLTLLIIHLFGIHDRFLITMALLVTGFTFLLHHLYHLRIIGMQPLPQQWHLSISVSVIFFWTLFLRHFVTWAEWTKWTLPIFVHISFDDSANVVVVILSHDLSLTDLRVFGWLRGSVECGYASLAPTPWKTLLAVALWFCLFGLGFGLVSVACMLLWMDMYKRNTGRVVYKTAVLLPWSSLPWVFLGEWARDG